jgi:CSLREA domain-containing protein/uncharacterized repeat protein (TIGR01451 family)
MRRTVTNLALCALLALTVAPSAYALTFVVDSTSDEVDAAPGDAVCLTEGGSCTLRAAIMEANALPGADIIDLTAINDPASPITLTIEGVDETFVDSEPGAEAPCVASIEANAAIGDLDITEDLEIFGAGPGLTVIQWENQSLDDPEIGDRIFHIQALAGETVNLVRIADLMITRGSVGIPNTTDQANVYNCDVSGEPGAIEAWQFKRVGGGITAGPGAAVFLFVEEEHGPGGGGGSDHGGPPDDPGGDEGEGGIMAVLFERIAMIGNQAGSDGGALLATTEMTILDSVFSGNLSAANGGALYLDSPTTIERTLIGTSASDVLYETGTVAAALLAEPNHGENGGGIFDTGSHTTNIRASAINGNTAIGGGGIAARSLIIVNITNSTISGNTGSDVGGGITTNGTINLRNVTVANNMATTDAPGGGAGLNSFGSGTYVFYNTILSNNLVQGGEVSREANCGCSGGSAECGPGRMVSTGYNVSDEAVDTCALSLALNDKLATDPLLASLANNGGLTETHALPSQLIGDPATSPAIDSGDNLRCPNNDQRGSLRPDDGDGDGAFVCDVGAYELFVARADLHINNVTAPDVVQKGDEFVVQVEVHNDDANSAAPGVQYTGTLNSLVGMSIVSATPSAGSCGVPAHTVTCILGDMDIGATETILLRLLGEVQGAYALESVAQAQAGVVDPVPGNNLVLTNIAVLGSSDIAVTAEPVPAEVDQGDVVSLNYTVTNNGLDNATTARLGMIVPAGASFVSASSTMGTCAESAGDVLCTIGSLAVGTSATVEIGLSVDEAGDLNFTAIVSADQVDPDGTNNSVTSTVTAIANADLRVSGSGPSSVRTDQEFDVTVTVTNDGPQDASNVLLTVGVPAIVGFVSADNCELNEATLECAVAALAAGDSASFVARFSTDSAGTATVEGSVIADENDPNVANNSMTVNVTISDPPPSNDGGGGGGGGCVYNPDGPADPTLPAMLLFALLMLGYRRRMVA